MINHLAFQNFRNYQSLDQNFHQGFVVLAGPNGAGKTNFLEGIYFGSTLRRFPESKPGQLFRQGQSFFRIGIQAQEFQLEAYYENTGNSFAYKLKFNSQAVRRAKYAGILPAISFLPQDLNLLARSPLGRRRFLNETLSLASAEYRHNLSQYERTLKQYRELLEKIEQGEERSEELKIWQEKLVEYGKEITASREELLEFLNANIQTTLSSLSPELGRVELVYRKGQDGPHLDDFNPVLEGKDAVGYVSRGQLRAMTLALKILEKKYLEDNLKTGAIMLLDDVFSEFDRAHQRKLLDFLKTFEQVFVTTAHLEEIKNFLPQDAQVYNIEAGKLHV